ncbi:ATP-binding protein [Chryseobacterium gallinarum]|uniref:AAA family ATPase n=1 Tax=Chryseobacterium gallinarum TaxID=1324352 RepID=UPI002023DD9D|nr:AAA family ATPase [Chryseobacterium gallinarum]MCL8536856.1 ATP-binding protein [Chryseobacterium gallinarum]
MQLRQSERKKAKIKMALQGSAGSGKTYSSLLLAQGLTNGNFSTVAVIDTENGSADLYAHLGNYNVLSLTPPFTPQKYVEAIEVCEKAGIEVIILDSISHCWDYLLDYHSSLAGNSFTNWAKIKPLEKLFIDKILQSNVHIIATMRTKQDYVLNQKDGKFIPEKVGLKAVQRDGIDFEFTIVFDVDIKHFAVSSKDRTGLFMDKPEFIITSETGKKILDWCNSGIAETASFTTSSESSVTSANSTDYFAPGDAHFSNSNNNMSKDSILNRISTSNTIAELLAIYKQYPEYQQELKPEYEARKSFLIKLSNFQNFSTNGHR